MNLSPTMQIALVVICGIAALLGASGIVVWLRLPGQKGLDASQKKEIDTRVDNLTRAGLFEAKQEFDRQVGELRSDQAEDRELATDRYKRMVALEKFADRVVPFYRKVTETFDALVSLIPGGWETVTEHHIVMPEPPTLPMTGHD